MPMERFAYAQATTVPKVLDHLSESCRPLAGGTDLLSMMKDDLATPSHLINIKTLSDLNGVAKQEDGLHIGALATLHHLANADALHTPGLRALPEAISHTATPQIRHMATIGGNLLQRPRCWYFRNSLTPCLRKGGKRCYAFRGENKYHAVIGGGPCFIVHPSDPAVALLAMDAAIHIVGPDGTRQVPLDAFYLLPKQDPHNEVDLAANELLTEIIIPAQPAGAQSIYVKIAERQSWDFSLVSVAVQWVIHNNAIQDAHVALGGVAPIPWRDQDAEAALNGQPPTAATFEAAAQAALAQARPLEQNRYKLDLTRGALKQALRELQHQIS